MIGARRAAAVLTAALLGGCVDGDPHSPCEQLTSKLTFIDANEVEKSSFGPGEPVRYRIVVTNHGALPAEILFVDQSCDALNAEVRNTAGQLLWQNDCFPPNAICDCATDRITLKGGQNTPIPHIVDIPHAWDHEGTPAGTYTGYAVDSTECAPLLDAAREFTLTQ